VSVHNKVRVAKGDKTIEVSNNQISPGEAARSDVYLEMLVR
jgi:hypothetical protein